MSSVLSSLCHLLTSANHLASQPVCVHVVCVHTGYVVPCGGQRSLLSLIWLHWLAKELQGSSCRPPTPSTGFQCWDSRLTWLFCGFRDLDLSSCRPQQALYPRNCVCSLLLSLLSRGSCADWPFQGLCPDFRPTYTMWLPPQEGETAGRLASLSAEGS